MENNPFFDLYIDENVAFAIFLDVYTITVDQSTGKETHTPIKLSELVEIKAEVRKDYEDTSPVIFAFKVDLTNPDEGELGLSLTAADSKGLVDGPYPVYQVGYYDIVTTNKAGTRAKLVGGKVFLNQTITS